MPRTKESLVIIMRADVIKMELMSYAYQQSLVGALPSLVLAHTMYNMKRYSRRSPYSSREWKNNSQIARLSQCCIAFSGIQAIKSALATNAQCTRSTCCNRRHKFPLLNI